MIVNISCKLSTEEMMLDFSADLACSVKPGSLIFLRDELGAGKTTCARGMMRGLGYHGSVKSPTYTLVECYSGGRLPVYHFDLFRLATPEDLNFIGFRDYLNETSLVLVEWPECAKEFLPVPDAMIFIEPILDGRTLSLSSHSMEGNSLVDRAKGWSMSSFPPE